MRIIDGTWKSWTARSLIFNSQLSIFNLKEMPILIKVYENKIKNSAAYGRYFGRVVSTKTMTYQELCKHVSEHNSVYGPDVCLGVANKLQTCILEQLLEGKKVQFGELGTFYLSVKSTSVENPEDYNLGVNIKGLFLCFAPSRTDVSNLSSKMLKEKATFMNVKDLIESKKKKTNDAATDEDSTGTNPSTPTSTDTGSTETGGENTGGSGGESTGGDSGIG